MIDEPWEHPDWYDLHDRSHSAGPEREPEHYQELLEALPPLDRKDHLLDLGAGTGKVASLVAGAYPELGRLTLLEPNGAKLRRATRRLSDELPNARIEGLHAGLGEAPIRLEEAADVLTVGSVFMVCLELHRGDLAGGLAWLRTSLRQAAGLLHADGCAVFAETLALPWAKGGPSDPCRRLRLLEFEAEIQRAGFRDVECCYRFRDRVVIRATRNED